MIVFDSSTLILLAKCELFDIFIKSYGKHVIIPKTVQMECLEKKTFDALLIEKRIEEPVKTPEAGPENWLFPLFGLGSSLIAGYKLRRKK